MNKKSDNQPVTSGEFKKAVKTLQAADNKLSQQIEAVDHKLSRQIKALDVKIDQREAALRLEIRITAQETKEDIREEVRSGNQKILTTMADFAKEVKESREERTLIGHQLLRLTSNVDKLADDVAQIKNHVFA